MVFSFNTGKKHFNKKHSEYHKRAIQLHRILDTLMVCLDFLYGAFENSSGMLFETISFTLFYILIINEKVLIFYEK